MTPRIVVLSSPSGGGKTTIAQALLKKRRDIGYSVSATTRQPRPGERDGEAYHFLSPAQFARREAAGEFLETAQYAGERYGTLRAEVERVLRSGRHVLLDIEIAGAKRVRQLYGWPASLDVFILPPSAEVLLERLRGRKTERDQVVARRIVTAIQELAEAPAFDYRVVNDRLEAALAAVEAIVDGKTERRAVTADEQRFIQALSERLRTLLNGIKPN